MDKTNWQYIDIYICSHVIYNEYTCYMYTYIHLYMFTNILTLQNITRYKIQGLYVHVHKIMAWSVNKVVHNGGNMI